MNKILKLKTRDLIIRGTSKSGYYRMSVATTTNTVNTILAKHIPSYNDMTDQNLIHYLKTRVELTATAVTWVNIMASFLQSEERFASTLRYQTPENVLGEPLHTIESLALGECRATAYFPSLCGIEGDLTNVTEKNALTLVTQAQRILYNHMQPVSTTTSVHAQVQRVVSNFTFHGKHFCEQSDGIPTLLISLAVLNNLPLSSLEQWVFCSGGIMIQRIAGSEIGPIDKDPIFSSRENLFNALWMCDVNNTMGANSPMASDNINTFLSDVQSRAIEKGLFQHDLLYLATQSPLITDQIANKVRIPVDSTNNTCFTDATQRLFTQYSNSTVSNILDIDMSSVQRTPLDFVCRCSKGSFMEHLISVGNKQIAKLVEESKIKPVSLKCSFCNKIYYATTSEIEEIIGLNH